MTHQALYFSDARIEVDSNCPDVDAMIARDWQGARRPIVETTRTHRVQVRASSELVVTFDGELVWREPLDARPADAFELILYRRMIADHCDRFGVFHGAAVHADELAFVFLGPSGAGKSSLAVAAMRRGYRYYSDEFVVTDGTAVWGWPRAPQFGPVPGSHRAPTWMTDLGPPDGHGTYRSPLGAKQIAVSATRTHRIHFVSIEPGPTTRLAPMSSKRALCRWLEAAFFEPPISLGGLVGDGYAWRGQWRHPEELLDALEDRVREEEQLASASAS